VFRGIIDLVDFYRLAERLVSWPSAREEHFRAVIGRAYIVRWGWIAPALCTCSNFSDVRLIGRLKIQNYRSV